MVINTHNIDMRVSDKRIEEIWKEYHPKLQVYLKQLFPHIRDIEDRVSDILMKVIEQLDRYNEKYALSTWIYSIARHSQIDEIRKKKLKLLTIDDVVIKSEINLEHSIIQDEENTLFKQSIETLKPADRELIYLYYYEELTYKDISHITSVPDGTLKYRMSEIRKTLKHQLRSLV